MVFLAISTKFQTSGFGTLVMNRLKTHAQSIGMQYFMTFADNNAIEFFRKQGFTTKPDKQELRWLMHESRWRGYIKEYSGSTPMQCKVHERVHYDSLRETINKQIDFVLQSVRDLSSRKVFKGLDLKENGGKDFEFDEIAGLLEAGWTKEDYEAVKAQEEKTFEDQCLDILNALHDHDMAWPFRKAVEAKQAPDYYTVITEPMWIERIFEKLKGQEYSEREMFKKDVNLIFENARKYNAKDTYFFKAADIMQAYAQMMLEKLKETAQDAENRKKQAV